MKRLIFLLNLFLSVTFLYAQQGVKISGKVTDNAGGLPGVSVSVKGTALGIVTDANGDYTIQASNQATLVFSFVGYKSQEVPVNNRTSINIKLEENVVGIGEVVVVGYGTQKKMEITGAIAQVKGEDISKQSSTNPISSLQGKVAGVQITNSGAPGASPEIRIRGVGTVYGNANPLYVVDGVWYDDISFLNPADIESINILKDAASESIYGIRAANGVILISSKKGTKNTATIVNYNGYIGNQVVTNQIKMANGPEFATMINELDATNKVTPRYSNPDKFGTTDWYHQILGNAMTTNHQISIAGGGDKSNTCMSF